MEPAELSNPPATGALRPRDPTQALLIAAAVLGFGGVFAALAVAIFLGRQHVSSSDWLLPLIPLGLILAAAALGGFGWSRRSG
jgi:di/tricarboxylate transporter